MFRYKGLSIGYTLSENLEEIHNYHNGLFGCFNAYDCGWRCCIAHYCCYSPWLHAEALSWVNSDLGKKANSAFTSKMKAAAARAIRSAGEEATGRRNVAADVLVGLQKVETDLKYSSLRQLFQNYMFGIWKKDSNGLIYLASTPLSNPVQAYFVQVCCAPCARIQEVDTVMRWRQDALKSKTRFANPFVCKCGFEEELDGEWIYPALSTHPSSQLDGENLLGRKGSPEQQALIQQRERLREKRIATPALLGMAMER